MYKNHQSITILCDNCKRRYEDEQSGYEIFCDKIAAEESFHNSIEWHKEGKKHYCPDCHSFDEKGNLVIKAENFKP